ASHARGEGGDHAMKLPGWHDVTLAPSALSDHDTGPLHDSERERTNGVSYGRVTRCPRFAAASDQRPMPRNSQRREDLGHRDAYHRRELGVGGSFPFGGRASAGGGQGKGNFR